MSHKLPLMKEMAKGYGLTSRRNNGLPDGYFPHWEFNVYGNVMNERFVRMFNRGSGGELDGKACAIYSSSMLAYNFFHWIDERHPLKLKIDSQPITFNQVFFEVRMIPLGVGISKKAPANMDVVLISKDKLTVLMLESKLLEYAEGLSSKLDMPESYLKEDKYCKSANASYWKNVISALQVPNKGYTSRRYYAGIKQNICHLIAIDNLVVQDKEALKFIKDENDGLLLQPDAKIIYKTLLFHPDNKMFRKETVAYYDYRQLIHDTLNTTLTRQKVDVFTYSELWEQARSQMDDDLQAFLQRRYMQFANL